MDASPPLWPPEAAAGGKSQPPAPPPAPLLLVPGVLGTMMGVRRAGQAGDGERCWVTVSAADANYKRLWGKYSKERKQVELLVKGTEAFVPTGSDDSGLYAISVLDPDVGSLVPQVKYFADFVTFLQGQGYIPGLTLFGCGYDFRQSCRASAAVLLDRLQGVSRRCGGARVDIVTHSMGGLVVRSLLADYPREFGDLVGRWVAIGCPFGGSPGYTVDALLTGVQFGGSLGDQFFVKRETFRQAALQSPSVYELLPPLDFPYAAPPPQLVLWLRKPIPQGCLAYGLAAAGQAPAGTRGSTAAGAAAAAASAAACMAGPACVHCPRCGSLLQLPATAADLQQAPATALQLLAGAGDEEPPLLCTSHSRVTVPSLPVGVGCGSDGGVCGSRGVNSSGMVYGVGSSGGSSNWANEYIFQHDHLPGLLARLLKDNAVAVGGASVPLPFDQALWALGQATHATWADAKLPPTCTFYNLHGAGVGTPYDCYYGAWYLPLQDLAALPHGTASFTFVDGDGTVPTESATAHGLPVTATASLKGVSHRDLVSAQPVWEQVLAWLQEPLPQLASAGGGSCVSSGSGVSRQAMQGKWQHGGGAGSGQAAGPATEEQRQSQRHAPKEGEEDWTFWNPLIWQALLA